ncbi:MAG: hypothetical protein A3E01_10790 [Gammaproteobacteria bacterium RIFCSPHIGHO2_12_FULL_63_22]|nr:MAG: hypothetical protein A3E01_10790 [Gammaproteobacteria bacterium RIFCSPHIGHO2_12_FULL_63_22]
MAEDFSPPKLIVTTTLPRDPRLLVRNHGKHLNDTLRAAANWHHETHIPRHFQSFAPAKYGYARRGRKYQKLKDRLGLGPLVSPFSRRQGRLPTTLAVMQGFNVTATQKRATLKMRLPFRGGSGRLRVRGSGLSVHQETLLRTIAEIEVISADEQRSINEFVHKDYADRANKPGQKYKVRTGG